MSRCRWGAALLAGLLLLGLLGSSLVKRQTEPTAEALLEAVDRAVAGDLPKAEALTERARAQWEEQELLYSMLFHQDQVEEVSSRFARLELLLQTGQVVSFGAEALDLAYEIRALGQEHSLALPHLL